MNIRPRKVLLSEHVYFVHICPVFAGPVTYNDLYSTDSPGNCATNVTLLVWVVSLSGAKMHRAEIQVIFLKFKSKPEYTLGTSLSMLHASIPIFSGS